MKQRRWLRSAVTLGLSLVLVALAAGCGSSSDDSTSSTTKPKAPAQATADVAEAQPSFYATTMNSMWEGFVLSTEDVAFNWILGEFGASNGNSNTEMEAQLAEIQAQLVQLNETLAQVDTAILQQTCDQMYGDIAPQTGRIGLLWEEYQTLLGWNAASGQYTNAPLTDTNDINAWVADVSGAPNADNPGSSVLTALTTMQQYLNTGGSGADSSITACLKAIASKSDGSGLPAPGTLDDRPYYTDVVQPVLDYYYGLQLQAMIMYIQLNTYLAWQAAGSPTSATPVDIAEQVCGGADFQPSAKKATKSPSYPKAPESQSPTAYCELAFNFTVTSNQQIRFQWAQGGAPYSTSLYLIENGTPTVWVMDLSQFSDQGNNDCPQPLVMEPQCGPTWGQWNANATMTNYWGEYSSWETADSAQWNAMLNPNTVSVDTPSSTTIHSTQTPWTSGTLEQWLPTRGFDDVGGWIILTGESNSNVPIGSYVVDELSTAVPATLKADTVCFLTTAYVYENTGAQPFCNGYGSFERLTTSFQKMCSSKEDSQHVDTACYLASGDYDGWFNIDWKGGNDWDPSPHWREETAQPAYHWPVVDVTKLTCSTTEPGATADNPGGVPSMCGADLTSWLNQQVPPSST